jgi:hypothetical protein
MSSDAGDRSDLFLGISSLLTGFTRVQLVGTGMADEYLSALEAVLDADVLNDFLGAYARLPTGDEREAAVASEILGDRKLGPLASNLILLWYCGTWTALPEDWRDSYGRSPLDTDRVLSADAYVAGLQWVAAGAHPAGARQQGFGAWALPPRGAAR